MKTAVIIPFYNQRKYWLKMFAALEEQTERPYCIYVAMDRQTPEDVEFVNGVCKSGKNYYSVQDLRDIPDYIGKPQEFPDQELFLTGYRRNQCIDLAIQEGCDTFIMFDGDCVPEKDLIKDHVALNSLDIPTIANGRRKEEKHGWLDQRDVDPKMRSAHLFNTCNGYVIHNPDLLRSCSITWSCNISMNMQAVKLIRKINRNYYGRDEVFNSNFLGRWGGEDSFLGIQAIACKIFVTMLNTEFSGIRHIEHPRPENKYGDGAFGDHLMREIDYLNQLQEMKPLDLSFYMAE